MEHVRLTEPATKTKRGRPRKTLCLDDGRTPIDPPTFARIKALQAAGHTSRHVADALQLPHACSEPLASHCETGLVSRRILGLRASCPSLPSRSRAGGPAAASACFHLGLVLAASPARHGFCSLSLAEAEQPRQDTLGCGRGEATDAFSERETHGHPPPSHHLKHHSGPVPLTVGKGRPPLEHEGAQVEAPQ